MALQARDHMRLLIERPEEADSAAEEALLAALDESLQPAEAIAAPAEAAATHSIWRVHMRLPRDAMINGANPLLLLDELRSLGVAVVAPVTEEIPPLEEMDPAACYMSWNIELKTAQPRTAIEDVFIFVRDEMQLDISLAETCCGEIENTDGAASTAGEEFPAEQNISEELGRRGRGASRREWQPRARGTAADPPRICKNERQHSRTRRAAR